jgi:hypothetical protein
MADSSDDTTLISFRAQVKLAKHSRTSWVWIGLIAGVVLLLAGGGYLVYERNSQQSQQAADIQKARSKMDVAPATPQ